MGMGLVFVEFFRRWKRRLTDSGNSRSTLSAVDTAGQSDNPMTQARRAKETPAVVDRVIVDVMRRNFAATMRTMNVTLVDIGELEALRAIASAVERSEDTALAVQRLKRALSKRKK